MAFHYYFNMEPLALRIAQTHINNMTNNNYIDGEDVFLDELKTINNLENGFVCLTQLSCYFESFLNTIITKCISYDGDVLLRCSIDEKLEIIYMHFNKDLLELKSSHFWQNYRQSTKVRNEMIHYKKTSIGWGGEIPQFKIGNQEVATYFTKDNMQNIFSKYKSLCSLIVKHLDLKISEDISIFSCDGTGYSLHYVNFLDE